MQIRKGAYSGIDWLDALSSRTKMVNLETEIASASEEQAAKTALKKTAQIAFGNESTRIPGPDERLGDESKKIQDRLLNDKIAKLVAGIKDKLAARGINPVELGVIDQDTWESIDDPDRTEAIAKVAAVQYQKNISRSWEHQSGTTKPSGYDSERSRGGRIIPAGGAGDDSVGNRSRVPLNANSIFDPRRLDRAAAEINEHDASIQASRDKIKAREAEKKAALAPEEVPQDVQLMKGSQVISSGAQDSTANVHRVPRNQLSILDKIESDKLSPDELKERLEDIFASRIPDTQEKIRKANKQRLEKIRQPREEDRSWEKLAKSTSTSELAKRLMNLWLPKE